MTPPTFYGLKNYERLVTDTKFMKALFNTLKLMVMIVPLQMILSLIVSVFLVSHRHMLIGKIANSVIFIPVLCSTAATGVIWRELLNGKIPAVETFFLACLGSRHLCCLEMLRQHWRLLQQWPFGKC